MAPLLLMSRDCRPDIRVSSGHNAYSMFNFRHRISHIKGSSQKRFYTQGRFLTISTPWLWHFRSYQVTADRIFEFLVATLPIQCAIFRTVSWMLSVLYRWYFIYRGRFLTFSNPSWGHFRWCGETADWIYEFVVATLPIQCHTSVVVSRLLGVVYRWDFTYRRRFLTISTPSWGHFR